MKIMMCFILLSFVLDSCNEANPRAVKPGSIAVIPWCKTRSWRNSPSWTVCVKSNQQNITRLLMIVFIKSRSKCRHFWIPRNIMNKRCWIFIIIIPGWSMQYRWNTQAGIGISRYQGWKYSGICRDSICKAAATLKAEQAVDSFFLTIQKKQYLLDSMQIPPKPVKPIIDTQLSHG